MLLATELRTVVSRLIKKLRSHSSVSETLSLTERSVLKHLDDHKALPASELAALENITSQSMSQIVNHLSLLGYIIKKTSPADKRKVLISLSKAGQNLLYKTKNERDVWLHKAIQETFTSRQQDMLRKILTPLSKLVEVE